MLLPMMMMVMIMVVMMVFVIFFRGNIARDHPSYTP
jgi:hypothetical protein